MRIEPFNFNNLRDFGVPEHEHVALEALKAKEVLEAEQKEAPPPAPPTYSESELEQARKAAKERGYEEGVQAGRAQIEGEETQRSAHIEPMMQQAVISVEGLNTQYHH